MNSGREAKVVQLHADFCGEDGVFLPSLPGPEAGAHQSSADGAVPHLVLESGPALVAELEPLVVPKLTKFDKDSILNRSLPDRATPCYGMSELFFGRVGETDEARAQRVSRAAAICALCDVRERCLEKAIARREPWGVWGGEELERGKIIKNRRPRGRPPKNSTDSRLN